MAYLAPLRRSVLPLLLISSLTACSSDTLEIDNSTRVSAVRPVKRVQQQQIPPSETQASYPAAQPVQQAAPLPMIDSDEALAAEGRAPDGRQLGAPPRILGQLHSNPDMQDQPMQQVAYATPAQGGEGVNMDDGLGVAQQQGGGTSLAQEEATQIAEINPSQPVVGGIGTDNPSMLSPGVAEPQASVPAEDPLQAELDRTYPVQDPAPRRTYPGRQVAMLPRPTNPMSMPDVQQPQPGVMPASERACRAALVRMGVKFQDAAPIYNGPTCGIPYPIKVYGFASNIAMKPAVEVNCQVTLAFAQWVKNELNPSAKFRYWSGVRTIIPMGGYSCRRMNSNSRNPWSEHARGNAIDVGKFVLNNGHEIDVEKPGFFDFRERGLLKAVRSDSCKYFHTVLGPGDPHHGDHFHFDLRARRSGHRVCD